MKIFLSWSGDLSKHIAECFHEFLPLVLQYTEPFMSSDDIARGDDWNNKINGELNNSRIGILFITPENINSNWLNFEAGALFSWKNKDEQQGTVMPVMINSLDITSVLSKSPLKQFQGTKSLSEEGVKSIFHSINLKADSDSLSEASFQSTFDQWWPKINQEINQVLKRPSTKIEPKKTDRKKDMWSAQDREVMVRTLNQVNAIEKGLRNVKSVQQQPDFVFTSSLTQITGNLQYLNSQISNSIATQQTLGLHNLSASLQNDINQLQRLENDYQNNFSWHI
ncbi:hypothetical protein ATW79_09680 [Oenococcus oeni]|uniref:toll/interleukin-1 receptor domain-containing protein n=1 Tax=Oenococcus oeni TaxID=1247 RepID=UPI0008F817F0|nr:toll/interleukin-1 receptor domain-containing protein [Oenococcus oeni]OIK85192.1 hypothetical protein ATW79_09680 [Oenococcus oeni]OIL07649.1 hypothetical protein ATW92_09600 [Oenococcus oeni]OIL11295.1 hypothetical protein ATW93_09665 [Oenococcus oeni]